MSGPGIDRYPARLRGVICWSWTDEYMDERCPAYGVRQHDVDGYIDREHGTAEWTCPKCGTEYAGDEHDGQPDHHDTAEPAPTRGEAALSQALFVVMIVGCALAAAGFLGRHPAVGLAGLWLAITPVVVAAWYSSRPRGEQP